MKGFAPRSRFEPENVTKMAYSKSDFGKQQRNKNEICIFHLYPRCTFYICDIKRMFSHDVTAAIFSYVNIFFCSNIFAWLLAA